MLLYGVLSSNYRVISRVITRITRQWWLLKYLTGYKRVGINLVEFALPGRISGIAVQFVLFLGGN